MARSDHTLICVVAGLIAAPPLGFVLNRAVRTSVYEAAVLDHRRPAQDRMLDPGRKPIDVLAFIHPAPGDRVLDVMASPGYYTELVAEIVGPQGEVTAYDPPQFVQSGQARRSWAARIARHPHIKQSLQPLHAVQFRKAYYNLALLHLTYHETYWRSAKFGLVEMEPRSLVRGLRCAVRAGGRVIVIDHAADPGLPARYTVNLWHRLAQDVVVRDFQSQGFTLIASSDALSNHHDTRKLDVYDPSIRGRTDRYMLAFKSPGSASFC